jgi:type IV pilus assembly protein PilV
MTRIDIARTQAGVVLIEALLGILIFSIGILALIGMQSVAVKNTIDARYRSEAAYLANSILSQIRLDMGNLVFYDDGNTGAFAPRAAWRNQVEALLPGVSIATSQRVPEIDIVPGPTYAGDADPPSRVTVKIHWRQPGEDTDRKFEIVGMVSRQ